MAYIALDQTKLHYNYQYLHRQFADAGIEWGVVAKVLCGHTDYLQQVINLGVRQICDSRITNLRKIKKLDPGIETIFIKPPAKRYISSVVRYADVSFNTEYETIKLLSDEAVRQDKRHKVVIMIEMGELREGVMRDQFVDFYERVFTLPKIEIAGIGTNLTCMYGILPSQDKLIQLSLYVQLVEARFNQKIPYISGGSSVTIPLIREGKLPAGINHFRVGETLFLGTDVYNNRANPKMYQDVFRLYAEIIELSEKPMVPDGTLGLNLTGHKIELDKQPATETSYRAIIDVGLLDVEQEHIFPVDKTIQVVGSSSDMMVVDLGENEQQLKVGSYIGFDLDYMGILRLMNCEYVDKRITYSGNSDPGDKSGKDTR